MIKTTPFAARAPYNEDVAASFKTEILSISIGLTELRFGAIKPSIIYKGALDALIDPIPRIRTNAVCPGLPFPATT